MQKLPKNRAEILGDLNRHLASCNLSYRQLSVASGLSYDAAWRYLVSRKAKNYNDNAKALCVLFGIQTDKTANLHAAPLERMTQAIHEVWDGSEPHAELIVELIKSTKSFKIDVRR